MDEGTETAEQAGRDHVFTITVVGGEGDEAVVKVKHDAPLKQLLEKGVAKLYGDDAKPKDYELVIEGVTQEHPNKTVEAAGLHDGSTVSILVEDLSRG